MSRSSQARRRRNALLLTIILGLLFVVLVIIIVSGLNKNNTPAPSASPTATTTPSMILPTIPPIDPTQDPGLITNPPTQEPIATPQATPGVTPIAPVGEGTTKYVTIKDVNSALSVRSEAKSGNNVIETIKYGAQVTVYSETGSWSYVKTASGKLGYVATSYLSSSKPVAPSATVKPSATAKPTAKPTAVATAKPTATPKPASKLTDIGVSTAFDTQIKGLVSVNMYEDFCKYTSANSVTGKCWRLVKSGQSDLYIYIDNGEIWAATSSSNYVKGSATDAPEGFKTIIAG